MENKLTHFDNSGNARIVDVSEKKGTVRVAIAVSKIKMSKETLELIKQGKIVPLFGLYTQNDRLIYPRTLRAGSWRAAYSPLG